MTCPPEPSLLWMIIGITTLSMGVGLLSGAALFYPIGRRHGIAALAAHWKANYAGRSPDPDDVIT